MKVQKQVRWQPIVLIGGVFVLYLLSVRTVTPPEGWATDFDAAVAEARETDRLLLLAFNMNGCMPCSMMDKLVLPEPHVEAALASFVPVRVDIDRQLDVARRFNVYATPTYAIVDADGNLLRRCSGFQPVEEFLAFLDYASGSATAEAQ